MNRHARRISTKHSLTFTKEVAAGIELAPDKDALPKRSSIFLVERKALRNEEALRLPQLQRCASRVSVWQKRYCDTTQNSFDEHISPFLISLAVV